MRIGVVGLGNIGVVHSTTLLSMPDVELVVVDSDKSRADQFRDGAAAGRVVTAPTIDALLGHGVDAVVVTSPTDSHAGLTARCVEAGLPVFCEKPIARTTAEAAELIRRIGASEVPVQVGFQRRHDAGFAAVRAAVANGDLGVLSTVRCATLDPEPPSPEYVASSGGIFRDCAIHDFDTIRWISGQEVVHVYATGTNQGAPFFGEHGDVDVAAAILVLEEGTLGVVSNSRYNGRGYDVRVEVHGWNDSMATGTDMWSQPSSYGPRTRQGLASDRFNEAYRRELHVFAEVVAGRRPSPCNLRDGIEAVLIADACERSLREGRPVHLQELRDALLVGS